MEVTCVAHPQLDVEAVNEWLESRNYNEWTPTLDESTATYEAAGRVCYMSFPPKKGRPSDQYIKNLFDEGHGSVFEHGQWSFILSGISRALSHELIRHRVGTAISQLSTRYVDANEMHIVVPPDYEGTSLEAEYLDLAEKAKIGYNYLVQEGEKVLERRADESKRDFHKRVRQSARYLLPHGIETIIFWSCNMRELRHVFVMRGSRFADIEFRILANLLFDIVEAATPIAVYGLKREPLLDGTLEILEDPNAVEHSGD